MRRLFRLPFRTPQAVAREVNSELEFHLESRIAELLALGMPAAEARVEAHRRFGNLDEAKTSLTRSGQIRARRAGWVTWLTDLAQDIGFALRGLRKRPGFAVISIATIGLGIGLTTAVMAVVNRLVLHPLPYPNAERLARVYFVSDVAGIQISPQLAVLEPWRAKSPVLEWAEAFNSERLLLENGETAELVQTRSVTPGMLPALAAPIVRGRGIQPTDARPGAPPVTLLSWATWRTRFGGASGVIGKTVRLSGTPTTIVGVVGKGFDLIPFREDARAEFWLPLGTQQSAAVVVLRRPGVTLNATSQWLRESLKAAAVAIDLPAKFQPTAMDGVYADASQERTLWLLTLAVSLVLAVACANVAALLLGRTATRAQEFGVRAALGAGRGRVIRQLITESVVLGGLGGLAGLAVALLALQATRLARPDSLLALDDVALAPAVLLLAVLVTLLVSVLFGLAPAWAARTEAAAALVGRVRRSFDSRFGRSLRSALVVGQLAASLVLLSGAGFLLRSFLRERSLPVGFEPQGLGWVTLVISQRLIPEAAVRDALIAEAAAAVLATPEIDQVAISSDSPLSYGATEGEFLVEGHPVPPQAARTLIPLREIGPGYFETIGMRLEAGRAPEPKSAGSEIVIDARTAKQYWPNGGAVGSRVRLYRDGGWRTIVGVALDQRELIGAFFADAPFIYSALTHGGSALVVRGSGKLPLNRVSAVIRAVDPRIRIYSMSTADAALDERLAGRRFTAAVVAGFAGLALLLAVVGLYGVIALTVSQRTYEMGVRIALGAAPRSVRILVLREGMARVALGLGLGFALVAGLGSALRRLLTGVAVWDPVVWVTAGVALALAGVLACWVPARRASRIDPLIAIRSD